MPRFLNPPGLAPPASRFSHGVEHRLAVRRLLISGQVGVRPDGSVPEGLEAQTELALDNLIAVLGEAGMEIADLVKMTTYVTVPGAVATFRRVRDRRFSGHAPASTYLEVAGLASPRFLVEIEGEAVKEFEP
jgi:enamine deaminase RidA (YjgF/YER057c/UK114 family)